MRISKTDLENFGLLDSLPLMFREYKEGEFYVFYYHTINEQAKLKIFAEDKVRVLNIALYRKYGELMQKKVITSGEDTSVGYFAYDSFESRSGLFYLFLNTHCEKVDVERFYAWCVENDEAGNFAISTSAMNDVYERGNFERILSFFLLGRKISSVMSIYDLVDEYTRTNIGRSLYGGYIKKVVQLIPYEGGVLPERNGLMRFMIIGEKALLTETEESKLIEAKGLLRSLIHPVEIYKKTGWFFNAADGKWRYNVSDDGAYISTTQLANVDGKKILNPNINPVRLETLDKLFQRPETLFSIGWMGKISDVLHHPELFRRYPRVANIPLLYRDNPQATQFTYYYAANNAGGYMMIDGNSQRVNHASTMLHESQHAVQQIEGFATGGNQELAIFVISIGGENIRKVFFHIKALAKELLEKCREEWIFENLQNIVVRLYGGKFKDTKDELVRFTDSYEKFVESADSFAFTTAFYLAQTGQLASGEFIEFLSDITNGNILTLTETINEGIQNTKMLGNKLAGEGYTIPDVNRIAFNAYEDLLGETESRAVEHGMMVESKYQNYFYLYEWENSPTQRISVISDDYIEVDSKKIEAAVEKLGEEYIMHYKHTTSTEPFLHELGHIVDDILCAQGHAGVIDGAYAAVVTKHNRSEFFVNCFLGYIQINFADDLIIDDLTENNDTRNEPAVDELLDRVFGVSVKFDNGGDVSDKHLSYGAGSGVYYIAPMMAKTKFVKLVKNNSITGVETANWILQRMSASNNERHKKILSDNPDCMVIVKDGNVADKIKLSKEPESGEHTTVEKFDLGGIIDEMISKNSDGTLKEVIVNTLLADAYYDKLAVYAIADAVIKVDDVILKYTPYNPIMTKFGEYAYFYPHQENILREGIEKAYIKYAAHLVTQKSDSGRALDDSKERALHLIEPALRDADARYIHKKDDGTESIIYVKKNIGDKEHTTAALVIEMNMIGQLRLVAFMPNRKKISANWIESTPIIPLSKSEPSTKVGEIQGNINNGESPENHSKGSNNFGKSKGALDKLKYGGELSALNC